ncbi:hypothetical protein LTR36_002648 [Oleoguttula mirabilis]|uniref:F-box domain-containing protein n=1 Tax=Oleoguttula mirabilis TaxID=1507867 RepID=A0AAV9JK92_9PEZI|nr:hypothetical protein LTR36_002648 [Oleoguttula mirabilis]
MDWNTPDLTSWPAKLVIRVGKKLRSNKQFSQEAIDRNNARAADLRQRRRAEHAHKNHYQVRRSEDTSNSHQSGVNELGEREYSAFGGEHKDHTDMLHRLAHHDSFDSLVDQMVDKHALKDPYFDSAAHGDALRRVSTIHERLIENLPDELWKRIVSYLNLADAASLALSSKALHRKLGSTPIDSLNEPQNKHHKIAFLRSMDHKLPRHLFCFPCAKYHLRLKPGKESLKADYVNNPLFVCPAAKSSVLPRMRLTQGRELPYSFVQLALRNNHSRAHGIDEDSLGRRWKHSESGWSHRTRFMVHDGRLFIRVVSQSFVPPAVTLTKTAERHILYDMQEYSPLFSHCAHWQDGDLMKMCKCWLSHVPAPPESYIQQLKKAPKISRTAAHPAFIVRGCDWCRPARRCPECPTEYLIEIQMMEDPQDHVRPFKHAIVVTRWSDLGNGSSPYTSPEWTAINGSAVPSEEEGGHEYESFSHVGRRAVSGIFESHVSGSIPGQRMLSLNPKNAKLGEEGHGWY